MSGRAAHCLRGVAFALLAGAAAIVAFAQAHSDRDSLIISYLLLVLVALVGALGAYTFAELAHAARRLQDVAAADAALDWLIITLPLLALSVHVISWLICSRLLSSLVLDNSSLAYALSVLGLVHALLVSLDAPLMVSASGALVAGCALVLPSRATSLYSAPSLGSAARPLLTMALGYVLAVYSGDTSPPGASWDASGEVEARRAFGWATRWALVRAARIVVQCMWLVYAHLFLAPLALVIVVANYRQQQRRIHTRMTAQNEPSIVSP